MGTADTGFCNMLVRNTGLSWTENQVVSLSVGPPAEEYQDGPSPKLSGLSLSAGGSPVGLHGFRATVPHDTTSVTVTPTCAPSVLMY